MKKFLLIFTILLLIFFTTFVKNSTKELNDRIFLTKENLEFLHKENEILKLEFDYLSSPKKINFYNDFYFDNELEKLNINSFVKISLNDDFLIFKTNEK